MTTDSQSEPARRPPAGVWIRAAAAWVDGLLAMLLGLGVYAALTAFDLWHAWAGNLLFWTLFEAMRFACWSRWSATPGKLYFGLAIVDDEGQGRLPLRRFAKRWLASWLSALPVGLGYLWAFLDDRDQTWHDKLAGTLVISRRPVRAWRRFGLAAAVAILAPITVRASAALWGLSHRDQLVAQANRARAEGTAFGRGHSGQACLGEAFKRSDACDGLLCHVATRAFLAECMKVAPADNLGCQDVPAPDGELAYQVWLSSTCEKLDQRGPYCVTMLMAFAEACKARGE